MSPGGEQQEQFVSVREFEAFRDAFFEQLRDGFSDVKESIRRVDQRLERQEGELNAVTRKVAAHSAIIDRSPKERTRTEDKQRDPDDKAITIGEVKRGLWLAIVIIALAGAVVGFIVTKAPIPGQ